MPQLQLILSTEFSFRAVTMHLHILKFVRQRLTFICKCEIRHVISDIMHGKIHSNLPSSAAMTRNEDE